jgi:signal transduction histidine kinase
MGFEDLRAIALFDGLTDEQVRALLEAGEERTYAAGDELFREARPADQWWVLLDGSISLVRHVGHEETLLGVMATPGQWAGGFQAWDEHGVYLATGRGATDGRVLRVPADRLRALADAWFPFGVHLIRGLVSTVRTIESVARQREALVALGTLAAGLAHEINNPASAATRAVDALEGTSETLLASLGRLARGAISAEQFVALDALRREVRPRPGALGPLAVADLEDELSTWLVRHHVKQDWLIAPPLAAAGLDVAWCERAAALLDDDSLEAGLEWVASSLSMTALLGEVKESTRRISELVAAVRSYSQLDRASVQLVDVTEGLESTLVMLAHKLGDGVTVVRDYDADVPQIEAIPAELNQVWTNLIDNAVDAMEGEGRLRISTRVDHDHVVVEIGDTGPGMSAEAQARAFEAFFTTKDVGKGTGLGLDISRRIVVDRHQGDISIERRADETVFCVRLPRTRD